MASIRAKKKTSQNGKKRQRQRRVRIGIPNPRLPPTAGLEALRETDRALGLATSLDAGIGPVKKRRRGLTGGVAAPVHGFGPIGRGRLLRRAGPQKKGRCGPGNRTGAHPARHHLLSSALFDDGGVALNADGFGAFGRHHDAVVGTLPGTWKQPSAPSSS